MPIGKYAILGRTPENERCESENENAEIHKRHERQGVSMTKENESSPRSHTIEWKPFGRNSTQPRTIPLQHRNDINGKYSADETKLLLRSPPNASVIPAYSQCEKTSKDFSLHQTMKDFSPREFISYKPVQMHSGLSQLFPYPVDFLRNRLINHHPHHYPYQLPFVSHGCSLQSRSFPGFFSPNYSSQSTEHDRRCNEKNSKSIIDRELSDSSRIRQFSENISASNLPFSTSTTATHSGTRPVETNQSNVILSNDELSSSDSEVKIPDKISTKKKRAGRRLFTGFQILELEKAFAIKQYLNRMERAYISQKVNLTECQIKTWFQNRRTKEKRRGLGSEDGDDGKTGGLFSDTTVDRQAKPSRIPGYGIQLVPTYGPPDHHLQAAIVNYFGRRKPSESPATDIDLMQPRDSRPTEKLTTR